MINQQCSGAKADGRITSVLSGFCPQVIAALGLIGEFPLEAIIYLAHVTKFATIQAMATAWCPDHVLLIGSIALLAMGVLFHLLDGAFMVTPETPPANNEHKWGWGVGCVFGGLTIVVAVI